MLFEKGQSKAVNGADIVCWHDNPSMRPRFLPLFTALSSLFGHRHPPAAITTGAGNLTQEQVDAILAECGDSQVMTAVENGLLTVIPASDIALTARVLEALRETGETTLSTVGNQRHDGAEG